MQDSGSIFFGNGMFNRPKSAYDAQFALQGKINPLLPEGTIVNYSVSYNRNENFLLQIVDVANQERLDNWSSFFNWLSGVEIAPDWFQQKMETLASSVDQLNYVFDEDLQQHVQAYKREILAKKKVIIVAHSQGNFYANQAHGVVDSESLGIVAVASPANFVAGGGQHTTLTNDIVMNAVRVIDTGTLPANATNSNNGEWSGHAFSESYLEGDVSGPQITGQILDTIDVVLSPLPDLGGTGDFGFHPDPDMSAIDIFILNSGGGVAKAATHDVYLAFDSVWKVGSVTSPSLAPGELFSASLPIASGCVGECVIVLVVDALDVVEESIEADNCDMCWLTCEFLGELCLCGQVSDVTPEL